ncbi:hypothetical protein K227x_56590 [Rubripirellula lacrimiformis]|uniref:Uncharacterized protein n=1 Tax=Rubripirellula lacrimiformis TaxID=1930273 RepID=A0A517NJM0_9BACT|nr:putative glycoside hydrolase [Rubripirellula lacrimiformis]QDT07233.1 hypothetical protein K227x_56590 [Rubripirellula lacrimiformis]
MAIQLALPLLLFLSPAMAVDFSLDQRTHPGITQSQPSIDDTPSKIHHGKQPLTTQWPVLDESRHASLDRKLLNTLTLCAQATAAPDTSRDNAPDVRPVDDERDPQTRFPEFSWDRIPLYMHVRKETSYTDDEIKFLAKFPLITFEKANGHKDHGTVEAGTLAAARAVKEIHPNTTILYYRNVIVHYGGYEADEQLDRIPGALLHDQSGSTKLVRNRVQAYDLSNAKVRRWWTQACSRMTSDPAIDGIFLDGNIKALEPQYLRGQIGAAKKKQTMDGYHELMKQTREAIGPSKLMLANILRARFENAGLEYLNYFDGSYLEGFFHNVGGVSYEDYVAKGIDAMQQAARQGKIIAMTTGFAPPGDTARNTSRLGIDEGHSNAGSDAHARAGLIYPLAIFLVCAEKHSYFRIHEGYSANESDRWMRWFPEYDRPLGPPLGPATKDGYRYSRTFEHASVELDIQNRTANIQWKQP